VDYKLSSRLESQLVPASLEVAELGESEILVKNQLARRIRKGKLQYLVKWFGESMFTSS